MATTTTKPAQQQTNSRPMPPPLKPAESKGAVAVIAPLRMAFPTIYKDEFEITETDWRALTDAIFPGAKTIEAIGMALAYCKKRNLDVFKRPVHIVAIYSTALKKMVESVWPGINELRTTAMRTNNYAGMEKPEYGPTIKHKFGGGKIKKFNDRGDSYYEDEDTLELEIPEWCEITVHRFVQGHKVTFPGPRVHWLETYATKGRFSTLPNEMWEKRSNGQLEKCAEAAALRRAFPEEIGDEHVIEEVGAFHRNEPVDITDQGGATVGGKDTPAEPTRETVKKDAPAAAATGTVAGGQSGAVAGQADAAAGQAGPSAAGQPAQQQETGKAEVAKNETTKKKDPPHDPKTGQVKQPAAHSGRRKRGTKDKPVTDVVDQNAKGAEADIQSAQERESAEPDQPAELPVFKEYTRPGDFFAFADPWLQDGSRTEAELVAFGVFYKDFILERLKPEYVHQAAMLDTKGLFDEAMIRASKR